VAIQQKLEREKASADEVQVDSVVLREKLGEKSGDDVGGFGYSDRLFLRLNPIQRGVCLCCRYTCRICELFGKAPLHDNGGKCWHKAIPLSPGSPADKCFLNRSTTTTCTGADAAIWFEESVCNKSLAVVIAQARNPSGIFAPVNLIFGGLVKFIIESRKRGFGCGVHALREMSIFSCIYTAQLPANLFN
jgi:hypothetical protein